MLKISQFPDNDPGMLPGNLPSHDVYDSPIRDQLRALSVEIGYMHDKIDAVVRGDIEPHELDLEYLNSNAEDILRRIQEMKQPERQESP